MTVRRLLTGALRLGLIWIGLFGPVLLTSAATAREPLPVCAGVQRVPDGSFKALSGFVRRLGIRQVAATVRTIWHVHTTGTLPPCFITKGQARRMGWGRGRQLARAAPGRAIGGDRFGNRERRLPRSGRYVEADLDTRGYRRGPKRLVFDRGTKGRWLIWVTVDHYRTFRKVPPPQ